MSIWLLTYHYQQSVFKRCHSDKHLSAFLPRPTRWRQKSTGMDKEQNYVTVTLCIPRSNTPVILRHSPPTFWLRLYACSFVTTESNTVAVTHLCDPPKPGCSLQVVLNAAATVVWSSMSHFGVMSFTGCYGHWQVQFTLRYRVLRCLCIASWHRISLLESGLHGRRHRRRSPDNGHSDFPHSCQTSARLCRLVHLKLHLLTIC